LNEREEISRGLAAGLSLRAIAARIRSRAVDRVPRSQRQRRPARLSRAHG
jgi:hypothetical protein